jgi:hypothetical protein
MARQAKGYWYDPLEDKAKEVFRHEKDIQKPAVQKFFDLDPDVAEEINAIPATPKTEDKIKLLAVEAGLVRARDWQQFFTIQFAGRTKLVLGRLAKLIEMYKNKSEYEQELKALDEDTRNFARDMAFSMKLKIDDFSGVRPKGVVITPDEFLQRYDESNLLMESKKKSPVRDIPVDSPVIKEVRKILEDKGYYKKRRVQELFEDEQFTIERKRQGQINEDLTLSRVWKVANDGKHIFAMISGYRGGNDEDVNQQRNKVLEKYLRKNGYGFNKVDGFWAELNRDTVDIDSIEDTKEDSFFVSVPIPEGEIEQGVEGPTAKKFIDDMAEVIEGSPEEDSTVPALRDVLRGATGFNQDSVAIKPDPTDPTVHLMDRDKGSFPLGEIEFFTDIRKNIKKLPEDIRQKLQSGAGGIAFSDLKKRGKAGTNKGGSFRAGNLERGE